MTRLDDLLDAVAEALLAGDLAALARLAPEVEAATVSAPDQSGALRLHRKAERNARLLQAATRGVKAARLRVGEIARGPTLTTYDARGRRAVIPSTSHDPARRV